MNIDYVDWHSANSLAVAQKGKPAVYLNNELNYDYDDPHIWETITDNLREKMGDDFLYIIHGGLFFFDTMKEAEEFFNVFNQNVVYASPIYAALYDQYGNGLTENT